MVIDGHMHMWPDKIAARALGTPSDTIKRFGDGTVLGAEKALTAAGIDLGVALAVSDTPERLDAANRFVASLGPACLTGFGSIHPGVSPEANVASLRANGLLGVKVHPLFQGYALDDPRLHEVLDALQNEFVCLFHVGPEFDGGPNHLATPRMVREIAQKFPRLEIIAAHFGGYHVTEDALENLIGSRVYVDTSWPPGLATVGRKRVRDLIERHGPDHVVFATDWPMANPADELAFIESLGLADQDLRAVVGGNLGRLLGLPVTA